MHKLSISLALVGFLVSAGQGMAFDGAPGGMSAGDMANVVGATHPYTGESMQGLVHIPTMESLKPDGAAQVGNSGSSGTLSSPPCTGIYCPK